DDGHLRGLGRADARPALDEGLDLVGDVRDHLHGAAEVLAAPLLLDHRLVDLAGGEVVPAPHARRHETFVVAEVEVGFGAVFGDEDLAVLERAHRARIDVDVRVELEQGDPDAARLEQRGDRRGGDALAERGHHATGDEYEFGHEGPPVKRDYTGEPAPPGSAPAAACQGSRTTIEVPPSSPRSTWDS